MPLSNSTIRGLADALTEDVVSYIFDSERYAEFMQEMIPAAIENKLGEIDEDVKYDLAMCVMDNISMGRM
jgi:hypothetical protein